MDATKLPMGATMREAGAGIRPRRSPARWLSPWLVLLAWMPGIAGADASAPTGLDASDWSQIRDAYERRRHAARATEDGYVARNPGQQWRTRFDGRGFTTHPDAGAWSWGLELQGYGFAGRERTLERPTQTSAEGGRVVYEWNDGLDEWYVNDRRGLEHGYTVHRPPPAGGDGAPLRFSLAVRGELVPEVSSDGRSIRFRSAAGRTELSYSGLTVFDASGRELAARFERSGANLSLQVDERGARYPLTIDPLAQQAYLKASNTGAGDEFGTQVAVSGNTVVVSAMEEDSSSIGVNGDGSNNGAAGSGAAYVFVRIGRTWSQEAYLKASNTEANDGFGFSVAVSGDTVVVGAFSEDSSASGVDGDESSNGASGAGAAYVFVRSETTWIQQAYLKASNAGSGDSFGRAVALAGDTIVVGASNEDSSATGVNGDESNEGTSDSGAAYVFVREGTTWSQQAYLKASNTEAFANFGFSVAVWGDTVAVGAFVEDGSATGVNGNEGACCEQDSGAAYIFVRDGTSWSQQAYVKASNTDSGDRFGSAVAVSDDVVAVGAPLERSNATGVNGDESDNSAVIAGAAYVFVRDGTSWSQQAYVKASNHSAFYRFGTSVALEGDTLAVGAPGEDGSAFSSGAVYVFTRADSSWSEEAYLKASSPGASDAFGGAVALSGDVVVGGAVGEDSSATGVNGDESNDASEGSGAAYVFVVQPVMLPALGPWAVGLLTALLMGVATFLGRSRRAIATSPTRSAAPGRPTRGRAA